MKTGTVCLLIGLLLTLAGCAPPEETAIVPTLVIDAAATGATSSAGPVRASGIIVPVRKVELSFPLAGITRDVHVSPGDSVVAGDPLVELATVILDARLAEAAANVTANQAQLNYLVRQGQDEVHLQSATADIDQAQAALDAAAANLEQATLRAPFGGTIAAVEIAPGEAVIPGSIVVVLGDLAEFQVETTDLSEVDVPHIFAGQAAMISVEALSLDVRAHVAAVALISESLGGDVVYRVTLSLDEQPPGMRWGMSAEIAIEIDR